MSQVDQDKLMSIVGEAMTIEDDAQRRRHLDTACGDDTQLRAEVEQLLAGDVEAKRMFERGSKQICQMPDPAQIGPYRLLAQIGEGGMGVVWRAEQMHPIRRTVALKLIKLGMDTRQVIARFESERQALAVMNHPNVARVIDAGATESGRPYFVMEYVPGEPITTFCDRHQYTTKQRLELFMQACEAVQHAHQKAILHRDLKPSNILVTIQNEKNIVKVIDFGIAKATGGRLTERTLFTESGQLIGTPEYMSPEQAEMSGVDVDTRSDIYSLGVILYELITGALPLDPSSLRSAGYAEIQRIIREVDPPRPSTRLSGLGEGAADVARKRHTHLEDLARQLRGELEWIPLKAMRKDRMQRYATADQLAEDIRNYLENRPLLAGPESAGYRLRKFLRRNKTSVAASAAMLLLLVAGIVTTSWQAIRATRARTEAQQQRSRAVFERDSAEAVLRFFTRNVLTAANPSKARGRDLTIIEALDNAAAGIGERFQDRPLVEAEVRRTVADTYRALGRQQEATPHLLRALELRQEHLGKLHPETLGTLARYGNDLMSLGRLDEAEQIMRGVLEGYRQVKGPDHTETMMSINNLAHLLFMRGRFQEAEPMFRQVLESHTKNLGEEHELTVRSMHNLATVIWKLDRPGEAEPIARRGYEIRLRTVGKDDPSTLGLVDGLAHISESLGRLDVAEDFFREAIEGRKRVLGADHPQTLQTMFGYGGMLYEAGRHQDATQLLRQVHELGRAKLGPDHVDALKYSHHYAAVLAQAGRYTEAEPLLRDLLERHRKVLGDDNSVTLLVLQAHALTLYRLGQADEAAVLYAELLERHARLRGAADPLTKMAASEYAVVLDALGRDDESTQVQRTYSVRPATQPSTRAAGGQ